MAGRTFAIGDIHGESEHLLRLLHKLPPLDAEDTLVFLGDYVDRGLDSAKVVAGLRGLSEKLHAKVVCLRGNHEDAWLRVIDRGWDEFVFPPRNGCLATLRSFTGGKPPRENELPANDEASAFFSGSFYPADVVEWMRALPYYYEDEHAIYVHAGLPQGPDGFLHPSKVEDPIVLLWLRTRAFFVDYKGKPVVVGHTVTEDLPQELSNHTPEDPTDLFAGDSVFGLDTGCGCGGFLTALELPSKTVYESREA